MARRSKGRNISGIVLLDKPAGMSSNALLQKVKRLYGAAKAGHTGSLDPIATGLLPVCLGEATKVSGFLLDADKGYDTVIRLGQTTTTGDIEGEILQELPVPSLNEARVQEVLAGFIGEIEQVPPMYSALKKDGQPLYKLARQGIEVERKVRRVRIFELKLLGFNENELSLSVRCSKGTYIRTLAEDIGKALGCGAHVQVLRRTFAAPFSLASAHTLDALEEIKAESYAALDALLQPLDTALENWAEVTLNSDMAFYVKQGQAVQVAKAPTEGLVKLYGPERHFLGIGHILDDGRVAPKRMICG